MYDKHVATKRRPSRPRVRAYKPPAPSSPLKPLDKKRFAERIDELARNDAKRLGHGTQRQFAEWIGIDEVRTVQRWRSRKNTPQAEQLHAIAERTGVSVDWLLGFDVPKYRGQSRATTSSIEADLALAVEHRLRSKHRDLFDRASVDGAALLDLSAEEVAREADAFLEYESRVVDVAFDGAVDLTTALDFWQIDIERARALAKSLKGYDERAPKTIEEQLLPLFANGEAIDEMVDPTYEPARTSWALVLVLRELALDLTGAWARSPLPKGRFLKIRRIRSARMESKKYASKLGLSAMKRLSAQARQRLLSVFARRDEESHSASAKRERATSSDVRTPGARRQHKST
jgi:transcriptional regulator with XRE-family HTH domain